MDKIWINTLTGQQIRLPENKNPGECWTCISDVETIISTNAASVENPISDVNMTVGNDFTEEDDQF